MEKEFQSLKEEFYNDTQKLSCLAESEALRIKYLGRKSVVARLFSKMSGLSKEEKLVWGKKLNLFKEEAQRTLSSKKEKNNDEQGKFDVTFPSACFDYGSQHLLSSVSRKICSIFEKLGFFVIEGNEIEEEWYNFEALNIPLEHSSRDAFDTFYLNLPENDKGKYLLRSHTSPSQVRVMQNLKPPLAVISPGRVYRPDEVDATHSFMFHQIEGFAVSEDINFAHLKGVLLHFAQEFFSPDVKLRFRPHFFPFTEPSAEVDLSCIICDFKNTKTATTKDKKCSVCKGKGWLEILGCGMIHPKVLTSCGIDHKKYKGFAFGMGVERIAMLKHNIADIRLFYENDLRFLGQFLL